jgi:hypothetical protein
MNVEIFSWEISLFVRRKASWALFGNLESPTLQVQFFGNNGSFCSFLVRYVLGSFQGCTNLSELLQPELFAKKHPG